MESLFKRSSLFTRSEREGSATISEPTTGGDFADLMPQRRYEGDAKSSVRKGAGWAANIFLRDSHAVEGENWMGYLGSCVKGNPFAENMFQMAMGLVSSACKTVRDMRTKGEVPDKSNQLNSTLVTELLMNRSAQGGGMHL